MPISHRICKHLFDDSPIGVAIINNEGYFIDANRTLCHLLEYTNFELEQLKYTDITHPLDVPVCQDKMVEVLGGKINGYEILKRYLTKLGKTIWVRESKWVIREKDKMTFISQIVPVLSGENYKLEEEPNRVVVRPTISVGQFVADNIIACISATVFLITLLSSLGAAGGYIYYRVEHLENIVSEKVVDAN